MGVCPYACFVATTPYPSSPEEGTTQGALLLVYREFCSFFVF